MPLHDGFLRLTPYDELFPDGETRASTLGAIADEVKERGMGDDDPGAFALLSATRRALADLRHPDQADDGGHTHAIALFHAYHLDRGGEHLLVSTPVARWAVEAGGEALGAAAPESGAPEVPAPDAPPTPGLPGAAYVQLPQHLFWVRESEAERPLSLDGFFWTRVGEVLHLLGVVDVQMGEAGLRVMPLPGVPWNDRGLWLTEGMRDEGEDFQCTIPGADIEGLYELRTAGELLKLAARIDRYALRFPEAVEPAGAPDQGTPAGPGAGPTPSPRPYRRLVLRTNGS